MSIFDSSKRKSAGLPKENPSKQHFRELSAGAGSTQWKVNSDGLFLGATKFSVAPFRVDYSGSMVAETGTFNGKVEIKDASNNVVILIDPNG